ncbi:HD domain-containing phosphohydrolase [Suilimivivens sp.]|uniref:HD-GYP domain-containing protein n=1 Tax=Suilimivivens sp. TaxID=2981669 RepID=UPI0030780F37
MELDVLGLVAACSYALDCVETELVHVTSRHAKRVAYMSVCVAEQLGICGKDLQDLAVYALLHDNALTQYIQEELHSNLTDMKEMPRIGVHCSIGEENIQGFPFHTDVKNVILYHHENADGSGPFGKKSEEVPLFSRIIHLCDLLDQACCRKAFTTETWEWAKDVLKRIRGTMVDEECAEALEKIFSEEYFLSLGGNFEASLWNKVPRQKQELDFSQIKKLAEFFAKIVDYKSPFTSTHSIGVAERAEKLSRYMGFDEETVQKMYLAGALHDIGKVAVGNEILEKPDRLTDAEFAVMKHHAAYTYNILSEIDDFEEIRDFAAFHHERLDGTGYPFGKDASELNVQERMMACIDIYQALTESRPYKKGMSHERACEILKNMADKGWLDMDIIDKIEMSM